MAISFTEDQIKRYSRHIILPQVGGKGQKRLLQAKVLLVGMQLPPNFGEIYETIFRELYQQLAKMNLLLLLPFLLEGVTPNQFQPDNLHPTADAQQHIMLNVLQELKHLLH